MSKRWSRQLARRVNLWRFGAARLLRAVMSPPSYILCTAKRAPTVMRAPALALALSAALAVAYPAAAAPHSAASGAGSAGTVTQSHSGASTTTASTNPIPVDEIQKLARVYTLIMDNYISPQDGKQLLENAIQGMISGLDPHSDYYRDDEYGDVKNDAKGHFIGIGVELMVNKTNNSIVVVTPIGQSPAAKAGIQPGDKILAVDGKSLAHYTASELLRLMLGKPGTKLTLLIQRQQRPPFSLTIAREMVRWQNVTYHMLPHQIAYIRVASFQDTTIANVVKALNALTEQHPQAIVLDLRNDPGGVLSSAVGVAGCFLPPNAPVVSMRGRNPDDNQSFRVNFLDYGQGEDDVLQDLPDWSRQVPMVALINVGTASAAEVVAGALQDDKRAVIMGNRSYGKGSVQSVIPLPEGGAIKLTVALYYTPKGHSVQLTGIKPDIVVPDTAAGNVFPPNREIDLRNHLSKNGVPTEAEAYPFNPDPKATVPFGTAQDYQLQKAVEYLMQHDTATKATP